MKTKELILGIAFTLLFYLSFQTPIYCLNDCVMTTECFYTVLGMGLLQFTLGFIALIFYYTVYEDVFKNGFWSKGKV